jgi:hypothetical protein
MGVHVSFPRNFVFEARGYNAPVNWKEKRSGKMWPLGEG